MSAPLPEKIGPYRVKKQIGAGGMGAVYLAFDERLERPVALKQVRPESQHDSQRSERLRREARAAARLSHPNIVQIYDVLALDDDWIVMEFAAGETLARLLRGGPLDVSRVLSLALDICKGLAAAHAQGIVHRDLKAENVIVTQAGQAKILDFGVAKLRGPREEATLSTEGSVVGTPHAMSPEQAKGEMVDHRSDLFSLGTLLYQALTGISPFRSAEGWIQTLTRVCVHKQKPARACIEEIPSELSALVDHLLEKDPNHRPNSAEELVPALQRITGVEPKLIKILFVDDEPDFEQLIRQHYRKKIRAGEICLEFATDGHEALRKLAEDEEVGLVMSDIRMPGMDGLTLLSKLSKLRADLLTIIISAYGDMENIRTAMNHGAFDFLLKPIDFEDLERTRRKATSEVRRIRERDRLLEENLLLGERNRFIRAAFGRYLSDEDAANVVGILQDPCVPGKKRNVTVLKASLQGFHELPKRLSQANLYEVLDSFFSDTVTAVFEYGGVFFEFRQGEMLILFGLSGSRKTDAQDAVDCAFTLQQVAESICKRSLDRGGPELALRVGIDSGDIVVVRCGLDEKKERLSGSVVARASHIEASSEYRQILVSETTIEHAELTLDASERFSIYHEKLSGPAEL